MATRKDYEALTKIAVSHLSQFNPAISDCDYMSHGKRFTITTPKAGVIDMMIDWDDNRRNHAATISIFAKFGNEKAARALGFDCNQFSGKWNHHFLYSAGLIAAVFDELRQKAF